MYGYDRLQFLLCFAICAANRKELYKQEKYFEGNNVVATAATMSRIQCALYSMQLSGAGFKYNSQKCQIFKDMIQSQSGPSSHVYGKAGECGVVPLLDRDNDTYTTANPYMGDNSLARYRCTNLTDTEPVNSCPVSRCEKNWSPASLSCTEKDIVNSSTQYHGRVTCTVKGVTCQRWDSSTPHRPYFFINRSDLHNWCQYLNVARPWCYTTDPAIRWDYCPVEERIDCNNPPPATLSGISLIIEWPYFDTVSLARYRCPTLVATEPNTSCPVARCISDRSWSTANVSCSDKDCYDSIDKVYNGRVTCTWTGITCQRWDSDYPHRPYVNRGRSDLGNRCVIDSKERPWCYTVDPTVKWDYCSVEECI